MSWYGLLAILRESRDEIRQELQRPPEACPNDGEPLDAGPSGSLHCPFDGYEYPRDGRL
ncbi:MAG TPA: hypothetical protein VF174_08835 [Micromonosporaceae bacterium]